MLPDTKPLSATPGDLSPNMATLADIAITRVDPQENSTSGDIHELVTFLHAATGDDIYEQLRLQFVEHFKKLIESEAGICHVARLKGGGGGQVIGFALFKLRFGGTREPSRKFVASSQQKSIHAAFSARHNEKPKAVEVEFSGDPVLTGFRDSLESKSQKFSAADGDCLSE